MYNKQGGYVGFVREVQVSIVRAGLMSRSTGHMYTSPAIKVAFPTKIRMQACGAGATFATPKQEVIEGLYVDFSAREL